MQFQHRQTSLEFDATVLDVPQAQYNPRVFKTVELEAERALSQLRREKRYTEGVRRHLSQAPAAIL